MDAAAWDERYRDRPDPWGGEPAETVRQRLAGASPGHAVDLACGDGRHARWLARQGWRVTAVDHSEVAIEQARAKDPDGRIDWRVGDVTNLVPDGAADLVLISFLHLPIPQLQALIATAARWLDPGGRLLYLGHSIDNHHRGTGGPPDPTILPGIADLAPAARGLRVDALEHVLRQQGDGTAIDILLECGPWEQPEHH
ncbi:class I SAM-dependent methyltransferase [Rhodococcus sp. NPDC058505]|uniref:class I SAM-dependent methyltransferase n=1 Tax=Rhodococcus sp. NPDC058505 TaxID=3346531 RepID=UPI00364DC91B